MTSPDATAGPRQEPASPDNEAGTDTVSADGLSVGGARAVQQGDQGILANEFGGRAVVVAPAAESVLPEQSREDTDAAWGEYPERDDDRLNRDRPPHW